MAVDVAAEDEPVAAEVPAAPLVEVEAHRAVPRAGLHEPPLQPVHLPALVGAPQVADVVDLEARALERREAGEPDTLAAVLRERDLSRLPVEAARPWRPARRSRRRAAGSSAGCSPGCDVMAAARAVDGRARPVARELVLLRQPPVEVDAARVGLAGQRVTRGVRQRPVGRGEHEPDVRVVGELALRAHHGVAGERLDRLLRRRAAGSRDGGELLLRDRVQRADRELAEPPRQLRGADDRGLRRLAGVLVVRDVRLDLRRTADAPRVEEARALRRRCSRGRRRSCPSPRRRTADAPGRRSRRRDRLTTAGSASTWPKSGFTVAVSVRPGVSAYLRSRPAAGVGVGALHQRVVARGFVPTWPTE